MRRLAQLCLGLAGVALVLCGIAFLKPLDGTYFWAQLFDTGHILTFGLIMVLLLKVSESLFPRVSHVFHYVVACVGAIFLGLGVEVVQKFDDHRSGEWIDLYNDAVGVFAFACLYAVIDPTLRNHRTGVLRRWCLLGVAGLLLTAGLWPFCQVWMQYQTRNRLFPVLVEFSNPWYRNLCYTPFSHFRAVRPPSHRC